MSVQKGDRATFRGDAVIVLGATSFLGERRWLVRARDGSVRSGFRREVAPESSLGSVTTPTWEVGDAVKVGWGSHRRNATITAIGSDEFGLPVYTVTYPEDSNRHETEGGTRWTRAEQVVEVGAEHLDTHT